MAKETKSTPEVVSDKVTIVVDPKRTNGGIRVNGKLYVGKVTVSPEQADDLLRIMDEYSATVDKLTDPSRRLRNQSIETSRKAFMADPVQFGANPRFSKIYGMLDPFQWTYIPDADKLEWQQERMGLFNY